MTGPGAVSVHASAVLVGDRAVLIRGPSGSGKSQLAFDLILAGRAGQIPPARLIGDDRVHLDARDGQLVVQPAPELAGLIEIRGLGIFGCDFSPEGAVGLVVDLAAPDAERMPPPQALEAQIYGIYLPRIPAGVGLRPLPLVLAALTMTTISSLSRPSDDCPKGIGNHISPTLATE